MLFTTCLGRLVFTGISIPDSGPTDNIRLTASECNRPSAMSNKSLFVYQSQ